MKWSLPVLFAACGVSFAVDPHLNAIQPRGGQRGTTVAATFAGQNLNDVLEIVPYGPGITVAKTDVVNKDTLGVQLAIAADCRLGEHGFRVRTAGGVSEYRTFWIGALPSVAEVEPNSLFDTPQPIPLNSTVHGVVDSEDADYYQVECKKGQRLSVEIEGMRLGSIFFDPYVAILDARRFELAIGDDTPLNRQDGGCSVMIPADGKYVVMVRESSYQGNGASQYRLHVGNFPRPTGVVPAGGKPGEEIEFRFLGDPAGEIKQKVKLPPVADPQFRLHCTTAEGVHPSGYPVRVTDLPNALESPPAQQLTVSTPVPAAFNGVLTAPGEQDYFKFPAKKGQTFELGVYARRLGSPLDPVLHVSRANGNALGAYVAGNDDSVGPDSVLRFTAPEDGEYVAWLHDHLRKGGPEYFYRIEVRVPTPGTTTTIPKVDGNNVSNQDRQSIRVPKGNRYATLVQVNRRDWGGPAAIAFDKLPPGVTVVADPCDPGQGVVPVVFEAAAAAAPAGVLADLRAAPTDPKVLAAGGTDLDVNFCIGLNNTPFHRRFLDRVAVAVVEAVPFTIEVVEPKAPVVQNGAINIKVLVKRAPGFKGPVTVYPLFTPPAVGITGATTIPENATEALIYCNAAPNAAARKWRTAFTGTATVTGGPEKAQSSGPVWVSSQMFTLEIAPPFVTFAQDRTAVEQGQKTQLFGKLTVNTPFDGKAKATVVGLPAKVTAPPAEFTKDAKELSFEVTTDKTSPAGKHGVFCQVVIEKNGELVYHNAGGNELRIDVPIPPKVTAAAPPAAKPAAPPPPTAAAPKRLSRLEQLRLEQEAREKAEKPAEPAKKN